MIRLAVLRHGHTPWNRAGRIQGRTDIALDPEARAGLGTLRLPPPWDNADLWSSPLSRATETATLVTGRIPRADAALMEMDWGDWEGKIAADLHVSPEADHRPIEAWGWDYCPPNGEAPAALRDRLIPWAEALERDAVAVCHIGVMRVLMAHATGWHFDGPAPFRIKRNRLYIITLDSNGWQAAAEPVRLIETAT